MTDKVDIHLDRFSYLVIPPLVGLTFGYIMNTAVGDENFSLMTNRVQCAGDFAIRLADVLYEVALGEGDRARQERGNLTTLETPVKKVVESFVIALAEAVGDAKLDKNKTLYNNLRAVGLAVSVGELTAGLTTAVVLATTDIATANVLIKASALPPNLRGSV